MEQSVPPHGTNWKAAPSRGEGAAFEGGEGSSHRDRRHQPVMWVLSKTKKGPDAVPASRSLANLNSRSSLSSARQNTSGLGSAPAFRKLQTTKKRSSCLNFSYRMNSSSRYLGSGHRASSTISSSLSIW